MELRRTRPSGRIDHRFIDQQNRNVIPHRIDTTTLRALQALAVIFEDERLFAFRADQDFEQILGNHGVILRSCRASRIDFALPGEYSPSKAGFVLSNILGSRNLVGLTRREAGENPALPRNCKRGNRQPVTGEAWEGRL